MPDRHHFDTPANMAGEALSYRIMVFDTSTGCTLLQIWLREHAGSCDEQRHMIMRYDAHVLIMHAYKDMAQLYEHPQWADHSIATRAEVVIP